MVHHPQRFSNPSAGVCVTPPQQLSYSLWVGGQQSWTWLYIVFAWVVVNRSGHKIVCSLGVVNRSGYKTIYGGEQNWVERLWSLGSELI